MCALASKCSCWVPLYVHSRYTCIKEKQSPQRSCWHSRCSLSAFHPGACRHTSVNAKQPSGCKTKAVPPRPLEFLCVKSTLTTVCLITFSPDTWFSGLFFFFFLHNPLKSNHCWILFRSATQSVSKDLFCIRCVLTQQWVSINVCINRIVWDFLDHNEALTCPC